MGAALTYARRYALFTLVGIAGEDDIDAPDLKAPMPPASAAATSAPTKHGRLNGGQSFPGRDRTRVVPSPTKPILGTEASAASRNQLVEELRAIASSDDAASWAHRILGVKNKLTEADARQVEDAFQAKLATLDGTDDLSDQPLAPVPTPQPSSSSLARQPVGPGRTAVGPPPFSSMNSTPAASKASRIARSFAVANAGSIDARIFRRPPLASLVAQRRRVIMGTMRAPSCTSLSDGDAIHI
jgi:hypothetical protein